MLAPDVVEFLGRHNQVFLLTRRADGWPTGYPMVGNYHDNGIEFSTYRASAKVARVMRDGRASCLVVPRDQAEDARSLWIRGAARILANATALAPPAPTPSSGLGTRTSDLRVPEQVAAKVALRHEEGKRCVLRVEVGETRWIGPLGTTR
jgi:hypothetical protein